MSELHSENTELEAGADIEEKGESGYKKRILLLLFLFFLLAAGVFVRWLFYGKDSVETIVPDDIYVADASDDPAGLPDNVPFAEVQADRVPQSSIPGGGAPASEVSEDVSGDDTEGPHTGAVVYSDQLNYHKKNKTLSMVFQNPVSSGSLMALHLEADGRELWKSGTLPEGYEITELSDIVLDIESGKYPAHLYVDHYDPDNGDLSVFRLDLECTLYVWDA